MRRAEQLTPTDIAELERMFLDEGVGDEAMLGAVRAEGIGLFLRKLLGLDRRAAKAAFIEAFDLGRLTANRIQFIDLIVNHLAERGVIDPRLLYESPFTDLDDQGLSGVFPAEDSNKRFSTSCNDLRDQLRPEGARTAFPFGYESAY